MGAPRGDFPALRLCDDWQIYDIGVKIGGIIMSEAGDMQAGVGWVRHPVGCANGAKRRAAPMRVLFR